jgi:hypothetical protein
MILGAFLTWKTAITFMFVSLFVILGMIVYKRTITKFRKGETQLDDFCILYSFEQDIQTGELEFYFTNKKTKKVIFEILSASNEVIHTLTDEEFKPGGHILRYNSADLKNGSYFYQLRTENQKTTKRMNIQNA